MPSRVITTPDDLDKLATMLACQPLPMTVAWKKGAHRTNPQNRLSHKWYAELAAQMDDRDVSELRAECKLKYGMPILRAEDDGFREVYDRTIKPLSYEDKISVIRQLEVPVTSLMTKPQFIRYLDTVQREFLQQGFELTDPDPAYEEWKNLIEKQNGKTDD